MPNGVGLPFYVQGLPGPLAWKWLVPRFFFIKFIMDIDTLIGKVIDILKSQPDKEKEAGKQSAFNSFWDEYKEQIQYEICPNYDVYEEEIKLIAEEVINQVSEEEIRLIFRTIRSSYNPFKYNASWEGPYDKSNYKPDIDDKREHIIDTILESVQTIAANEPLIYKKPYIRYISYLEDDQTKVAEIIERINPWEYVAKLLSNNRGISDDTETLNLTTLKRYNNLKILSEKEFEQAKLKSIEKSKMKKAVREIVKLRAIVQKKHPRQVLAEMKAELEERKALQKDEDKKV